MHSAKSKILSHPLTFLFILALTVRLVALAVQAPQFERPLTKDSFQYHRLATGLLAGEGLSVDGQPSALAQPLYPLCLAAVYVVAPDSRTVVALVQIVLSALTVVLLAGLARELAGERVALAAGIGLAFYWPLALLAAQILTETLFVFLLVGAVYCAVLSRRRRSLRLAGLAGLALGLACLVRAVVLYLAPLAAVGMLLHAAVRRDQRSAWGALLFAGLFCAALTPWMLRNWRVFHTPAPGGTNSGMVLYSGNFPPGGHGFGMNLRPRDLPPADSAVLDLPELDRDRALKALALRRMKQQPAEVARVVLQKALFFWVPLDWEILRHTQGVLNPWYIWLMLFAALWLVRRERWRDYLVPAGVIAYFFLISLATYGSPRLRLPVEPLIMLFAAAGWADLDQRMTWRGRVSLAALMILTGGVGYWGSDTLKAGLVGILSAAGLW